MYGLYLKAGLYLNGLHDGAAAWKEQLADWLTLVTLNHTALTTMQIQNQIRIILQFQHGWGKIQDMDWSKAPNWIKVYANQWEMNRHYMTTSPWLKDKLKGCSKFKGIVINLVPGLLTIPFKKIPRSGNSELLGCFLPTVYSKSSNPIHQSQNRNQRQKIKKKSI